MLGGRAGWFPSTDPSKPPSAQTPHELRLLTCADSAGNFSATCQRRRDRAPPPAANPQPHPENVEGGESARTTPASWRSEWE